MTTPLRGIAVLAGTAALVGGCTNLSGLDGSTGYSCKAPEGVTCASVSGTYANALANNLPGRRPPAPNSVDPTTDNRATQAKIPAPAASMGAASSESGPPSLRSPPRILRLWFKAWEDNEHDLHDAGYVYVQIDGGRWLIEHARHQTGDTDLGGRRPLTVLPTRASQPSRTDLGPLPNPSKPQPTSDERHSVDRPPVLRQPDTPH